MQSKLVAAPAAPAADATPAALLKATRTVTFPIRPDFDVSITLPREGLSVSELKKLLYFMLPYATDWEPSMSPRSVFEVAPSKEPALKSKITQALYADSEMRGFYLIVTPTKRSFYVQSLVNGKQVRTKLGDHPSMDAKQARDAARKMLVDMRSGANPNEERRKARARGITLRQALDLHLAAKALSPRTVEDYRHCCDQYLSDWLDKPLAELGVDRSAVRERHRRITEKHGPTCAAGARRGFRRARGHQQSRLRCCSDGSASPCRGVPCFRYGAGSVRSLRGPGTQRRRTIAYQQGDSLAEQATSAGVKPFSDEFDEAAALAGMPYSRAWDTYLDRDTWAEAERRPLAHMP